MAKRFHTLDVGAIDKSARDCAIVEFIVPEELHETFSFIQGQYLTLRTTIDNQDVRRSYSICTNPSEKRWKVGVKKITGGLFSTFVNDVLAVGDTLEVMPPDGRFFIQTDPTQKRNYVAFAAGSGITPILSIIKTHLETEPDSTFKLFYTNQTVASIILKEELEALKNIYLNRFEIFYFLTKELRNIDFYNGRITTEKLDLIFKNICQLNAINDFFLCGPQEMIFLVRDYVTEKGHDPKNVHFELFNTDTPKREKRNIAIDDDGKMSDIRILEGGKEFNFKMPIGSGKLLDAALNNAADLPFACKGGVCCTCRAKLIEGKVEMEVNYALEPDEVEDGYILTCQSIPLTDKIVVDFDA